MKSVGHSMTLERDIDKREEILRYLLQLSEMVGRRARRYGVTGKTISLYVRYADFDTSFGKQQTQCDYLSLSEDIYRAAVRILDSVNLEQPIRLLGVRLSNLRHREEQLPLFIDEKMKVFATRAMDEVNNRYGDFTVTFGALLSDQGKNGSFVISPAWRPDGIRCVEVG
ncbi:MAG: hypothetical protein MZU95_05335 [Desulfomicrobium escambiense]|nr:hypothetical protein [Desulfomicrobium escambiense]